MTVNACLENVIDCATNASECLDIWRGGHFLYMNCKDDVGGDNR